MNLKTQELMELIARGETLKVEFKSDLKQLPDRELVATIMSLANTEGGDLLLGVEDSGVVTGLHFCHSNTMGMVALIANKTNPPVSVRVEIYDVEGKKIARIYVPKSKQLVSTSEGLLQRRRLMASGKPEAIPFYPHEFIQRQSALGLIDPSAMPVTELTVKDLNPLERQRIREAVRLYRGDVSLLSLTDEELDGALGLVINVDGIRHPTLAGLLLLGREEVLRQYVPSYEVAFQVLERTEVRVNEFFRKPLLQVFEEIERLFAARLTEKECQIGLFRVPIPSFDKRAFREAFVNALVHRDYARLGAIHVRIDDDGLSISNPGGFVEGVTLDNFLVTEPHPRNPLLADISKRLGLSERTGRGVDRIFEGLLRYGRPAPDYTRSSTSSVVVRMSNAESDIAFLEVVLYEEERTRRPLPLGSLIILSRLRQERRLTTVDLAQSIQKSEQETRTTLESLVESGLVEAHGIGRGRSYTLSARLYQKSGQKVGFVRQVGFDPIQQEQMIKSYIKEHKTIKRAEVADLCRISLFQASRLLKKLTEGEVLVPKGRGKGTFYERRS
ncbi:MAG: putative DNA binding domain-containing protein [Chlamydiales bacterium]|nr:putative DNA binding domain-containing protein [Chlamydiales bacterium]